MPRIADHPRASLGRTLELAAAVETLGGECSAEAAAEQLGSRPGGAFGALVSTAVKFGWIAVRRGRLRTEPRYRDYRLAYDEAERRATLAAALRNVPLFTQLLDRFAGKSLPEDRLGKLLVREFRVPEAAGERVAGYFLDAVGAAGLLAGGQLRASPTGDARPRSSEGAPPGHDAAGRLGGRPGAGGYSPHRAEPASPGSPRAGAARYTVRVSGPELDSTVEITEAADLDLARSLLAKVERALLGGTGR